MTSDATKINFPWKHLLYPKHTDTAKEYYEEIAGINVHVPSSRVWSEPIPSTPPGVSTAVIEVYDTLTLTEDVTVGGHRAWYAPVEGFIPPVFGQGYTARCFDGGDTEIPSSHASVWNFDYDNGILWFENDPTSYGFTLPIKVKTYRYIGATGGAGAQKDYVVWSPAGTPPTPGQTVFVVPDTIYNEDATEFIVNGQSYDYAAHFTVTPPSTVTWLDVLFTIESDDVVRIGYFHL